MNDAFLTFKNANCLTEPRILLRSRETGAQLQNSVAEALFFFFSNQYNNITAEHFHNIKTLFAATHQDVSNFLTTAKVMDSEQAINSEYLQINNARLAQLIQQCRQEDFAIQIVKAAIDNDLHLPSPFSNNTAQCQESYEVKNGSRGFCGMNCLRFIDGDRCFFLMQYASSADGIYFPDINLLVCLAHLNAAHVRFLKKKLLADFAKIVAYAQAPKTCYGVIASHFGGLGHFYYENWPVWFEIYQQAGLYQQIPQIIMRKGYDFNDLQLLFGGPPPLLLASEDIDDKSLNGHYWFVFVGTGRDLRITNACYSEADQFLVNKVLASPTEHALAKVYLLQDCHPIVWLGVEGQKRCWLEQVEGYSYIINQLAERYPHLGVVIDGWTVPFSESKSAVKESEKDRRLAKKIIKKFKRPLPHVFLMGENSNTKITVGNKIDFFICNFASGSLHVSRLLGKPGFCHLSGVLSSTSLRFGIQVHPNKNVFLLPKKYVQDRQDSGVNLLQTAVKLAYNVYNLLVGNGKKHKQAINLGRISYSIDKQDFYRFIEPRLEKMLTGSNNDKLRFFIEPSFSIHPSVRQYLKIASYGNVLEVFPTLPSLRTLADMAGFSESYLKQNIIYGLFPFGSHHTLNQPSEFMIWLSDPIDQVCLHALQVAKNALANQQPTDMGSILNGGHKILDNYYTRLISGIDKPFGECTETMLETAINNLHTHFVFIGVTEQLSASFDRLCTLQDWDRDLFPDQLPDEYQVELTKFPDNELQTARNLVGYDLRLYDAAVALANKLPSIG